MKQKDTDSPLGLFLALVACLAGTVGAYCFMWWCAGNGIELW